MKGGVANNKFGSMTFDKLWNLDSILLTFIFIFIFLSTLIDFQNAKAVLIWSIYIIVVVLQSLVTILERDPRFWRYMLNLYGFVYIMYLMMNFFYIILVSHVLS